MPFTSSIQSRGAVRRRLGTHRHLLGRTVAGVVLVAAACTVGCARRQRGQPQPAAERAPVIGPISLQVVNRGPHEAVVHAVRGSFRQRLGLVRGLSTTRLTVPQTVTADRGTFVLVVSQIGGPEQYVSDAIAPQPDIRLVLLLNARFASSTLSVE